MVIFSRIALALMSVLILAKILPEYAAKMFPKDYESVYLSYSAEQDRFILEHFRSGKRSFTDVDDHPLTEDEVRTALPFSYLNYLNRTNQLPTHVAGWPLDTRAVGHASARMRYHPFSLDNADHRLYTLLESVRDVEGRFLTPPDMFRMNQRMEFIDMATNQVDEAKTALFSNALADAGFVHPASMVADSPSTLKDYDNGTLLADAQRRVFHVWQINGQPKVTRTDAVVPDDVQLLRVLEQPRREYHGLYVQPGGVTLLDWSQYAKTPIPLQDFQSGRDFLGGDADPLNWHFSHASDKASQRTALVTDPQLQPVRRYVWHEGAEDQQKRSRQAAVMGFLFPFQVHFSVREHDQRGLYFSRAETLSWVALLGVLTALLAYTGWHQWRWRRLPNGLDLLLIAATGWLGAIALAVLGPLAGRVRRA